MALCKLNKITIVSEKWKRKNIQSEPAMIEIQGIIDLKESEMPPCTCANKPKNDSCPMPKNDSCSMPKNDACSMPKSGSCPMSKSSSCPTTEESGSCHTPGPSNVPSLLVFSNILINQLCLHFQ